MRVKCGTNIARKLNFWNLYDHGNTIVDLVRGLHRASG
jgi:hypothetical protein